ncbi:unnamed protein product [Protopolystoma xenopodis]|uniref:Uncharacterized protein n=1 Tax=Protopolystoma xenopodis TaxID=117903 RepID=A0A448XJ95_9PLAT|nr:unnamed protein product [Protopolystoma xenopodis]
METASETDGEGCNFILKMVPLTDDAGERSGYVPRQRSDAGNHEYYAKGQRGRCVPQALLVAPTKLPKRSQQMIHCTIIMRAGEWQQYATRHQSD